MLSSVNKEKPKISLIILCYEHEKYIQETILAAFAQDYDNLEIVISDDNSSDSSYEVITSIVSKYNGPHDIVLNLNSRNLGLIKHINHIFENLASGDFFVINAGDDISLPTRCSSVYNEWRKDPATKLVYGGLKRISENGQIISGLKIEDHKFKSGIENIINYSGYSGALCAYHRDVYDVFGAISCSSLEDRTLIYRAFLLGGARFSSECHVYYRVGGVSDLKSKENAINQMIEWDLKHQFDVIKQLIIDVTTYQKLSYASYIKIIEFSFLKIKLINSLRNKSIFSISFISAWIKFFINFGISKELWTITIRLAYLSFPTKISELVRMTLKNLRVKFRI